jgi:hypothetical protein
MKGKNHFPPVKGEGGSRTACALHFDLSIPFFCIDIIKSLHKFGACSTREFPSDTFNARLSEGLLTSVKGSQKGVPQPLPVCLDP